MTSSPGLGGSVVWALGLACLAGCQQCASPSAEPLLPSLAGRGGKDLNPRQVADVQVALGGSLEKRGEPAEAMARYTQAVRQDPARADAWLRLAVLHDQQGQFNNSLEMYQQALRLRPGDPDIFCDMGYSLYLQRRWAEAEMNLRQAVAVRPDHRRAHNNLGLVLARTDRGDEALAEFRRAGCDPADVHINLAFALTLERRWPEAQRHYEEALAANPSSAPARKGLEELNAVVAKAAPALGSPSGTNGIMQAGMTAPPAELALPQAPAVPVEASDPSGEGDDPSANRDPN